MGISALLPAKPVRVKLAMFNIYSNKCNHGQNKPRWLDSCLFPPHCLQQKVLKEHLVQHAKHFTVKWKS